MARIPLTLASLALATIIGLDLRPTLATTVCLTKKEARELWPKAHLYWYSKDRCWSNRRGPPRNLKIDPIKEPVRAQSPGGSEGPARLMPPTGTHPEFLIIGTPMPLPKPAPRKLWKEPPLPECCWPKLDTLIDLSGHLKGEPK